MSRDSPAAGLRIFAADEDRSTLDATAELLRRLGHAVTASAVTVRDAAETIAREDPDLSVVTVHADEAHALDLCEEIREYARGPLVVLLGEHDSTLLRDAAERGIDAFARPDSEREVQAAIELAMRQHEERSRLAAQVEELETALERRGIIERAKGILMERHGIDERAAFELLRGHARSTNRRVVELARAVADSHPLLPSRGEQADPPGTGGSADAAR